MTRGQIAKVVSQAAGFNDSPGTQIYSDVPPSHTFYAYINGLSRRGIVSGYSCSEGADSGCSPEYPLLFRPERLTTRGQLAKIVSNAANISDEVSGQIYADVPSEGEGSTFYVWIMRLSQKQVMGGYACGTSDPRSGPCDEHNSPYFRPNNDVSRGQVAKIVANTFFPTCLAP